MDDEKHRKAGNKEGKIRWKTETFCCSAERLESVLHVQFVEFHRLVGLVVKASASRSEDPGFESRLRGIFSGSSHTGDLKIGTPVATLPGAWHYRISTGTGRPGVSIL